MEEFKNLIKLVPVTSSDVLSWNSLDDLKASHEDGDVAVVPSFLEGEKAEKVFSKRGSFIRVGDEKIKNFSGEKDEAVQDFINEVLHDASGDKQKAVELVKSSEWWEI